MNLPRLTILPWLLWALVVAFAIFGVIYATKSHAALDYRGPGNDGHVAGLRLSEAPCSYEKVLAHIKEAFHKKFKAAVLTYSGRDWQSCYIEFDAPNAAGIVETFIFSIDEEGAPFNPVPKRMFREDSI